MNEVELLELIRNGEDSVVEFKREGVRNHDLAKTLVAFGPGCHACPKQVPWTEAGSPGRGRPVLDWAIGMRSPWGDSKNARSSPQSFRGSR